MILVGLTGSVGMGKSTTTGFFDEAGFPVWDADACVHRLYARGGAAVSAIAGLCPRAVVDGSVDRRKLRAAVAADQELLTKIEAVVHPLVALDRMEFIDRCRGEGRELAVCEVPLLLETGARHYYDKILVVTAPADLQRERVMSRPGMTATLFESLLARQMSDAEKRRHADFVVDTSMGVETARARVHEIITSLLGEGWNA